MAIIDGIRGLQVEIKIGGKTAEEHDPLEKINKPSDLEFHIPDSAGSETPRSDSDIPYVVKFIEATPGALFYIQVNQLLDFKFSAHHIGFSITVDSLIMGVNHDECEKNRQLGLPWNPKASHWISKNEAGVWQRNYFQFAQLPIGESCGLSFFFFDPVSRMFDTYFSSQMMKTSVPGRTWKLRLNAPKMLALFAFSFIIWRPATLTQTGLVERRKTLAPSENPCLKKP